jgi:hypothetical protein
LGYGRSTTFTVSLEGITDTQAAGIHELHDQPPSRAQAAGNSFNAIVPHVCHEQPAQKANDPQCVSPTRPPFLRVSSRGQGYEEPQAREKAYACQIDRASVVGSGANLEVFWE